MLRQARLLQGRRGMLHQVRLLQVIAFIATFGIDLVVFSESRFFVLSLHSPSFVSRIECSSSYWSGDHNFGKKRTLKGWQEKGEVAI